MSWSVSGSGTPAEIHGQLSEQFKYPLAEAPAGLSDEGEKKTVQLVADLCEQILETYDETGELTINAAGHMGFYDWGKKTGAYQSVTLTVTPGAR